MNIHSLNSRRTTIKIPLSRLKRDAIEKLEKTPLQIQMEIELLRRRERDAQYEDITEVNKVKRRPLAIDINRVTLFVCVHWQCPYQPFPEPLPNLFFRQLSLSSSPTNNSSENSSPSAFGPRYRKRVGRGGRIFIDRVGFRPRTVPVPSPAGGKTSKLPGSSYKFDHDSETDESEYEVDVMDDM